jgi:hypothetical protein
VLAACSNELQRSTGPSLPAQRSDVQGQDIEGTDAVVCVSGDSPAGNYTFTVSAVNPGSGGSTVTGPNPAVVGKGSCFALVSRLAPEDDGNPSADPASSVTFSFTSSNVLGATHTGTICVDDPGIPASSPCGATVTSYVNFVAGSVATFSFTSPAQMIEALRTMLASLDISKAPGRKLDDRLREALKALDKGQADRACKELEHFIKETLQRGSKKIGGDDAADLIEKANEIQLALGC